MGTPPLRTLGLAAWLFLGLSSATAGAEDAIFRDPGMRPLYLWEARGTSPGAGRYAREPAPNHRLSCLRSHPSARA